MGSGAELRNAQTEKELTVALVTASKISLCQPLPEVVFALNQLQLSSGRLTMQELARTSGMVERTLRRRFSEAVGLPVKTLASILRFQRTAKLLAQSSMQLAVAAIEGGYCDQAHMTREFRRFCGSTPGQRIPMTFGNFPLSDL